MGAEEPATVCGCGTRADCAGSLAPVLRDEGAGAGDDHFSRAGACSMHGVRTWGRVAAVPGGHDDVVEGLGLEVSSRNLLVHVVHVRAVVLAVVELEGGLLKRGVSSGELQQG